jgi:DNA-binding LacI/PurR family transcriptional regulator
VANLFAQLRSSKTVTYQSTLGLVYVGRNPAVLKLVPTFRDWVTGCQERAASLGYRIDRFSVFAPEIESKRLVQILRARNITGLVIIGPFENNIIPPGLDPVWQNSAAIIVGVRPLRPELTFVSNDQFSTAAEAMRELAELGYERPGLCIDSSVDNTVENRFSGGYCVAQRKLPARNRLPVFDYGADAEERFKVWVERHGPDVIVTVHREVEAWVKSMGLAVPKDIGLVHLDRSSEVEKWAGMQQNNVHVGRAAVDMVVGQLHRNELGLPPFQKCMFITSTWAPGRTVRSLRG